jgi:regulator of PEP synthase PpsR (kinase-PPPase family)
VYGDYSDPSAIRQEIQFANMLFEQNGWTVLDMTTKSIEEAAAEIYDTLLRQGNQSADK